MRGVSWANEDTLSVVLLNREQNVSVVSTCPQPDWVCTTVFEEDLRENSSPCAGEPVFNTDTTQLVIRTPLRDGDRGYFQAGAASLLLLVGNKTHFFIQTSFSPL